MKPSQLERLRQLGDLREKGLLTDEEFAEQKGAVMGSGEPSEPGRRARWLGGVVLLLSLAVSGFALYFAFDARDRAKSEAQAVRAAIPQMHPKLVIEEASTDFKAVPADGYRHNVEAQCHYPNVVLGGGYAPDIKGGQPTILASFPSVSQWSVGAASEGKQSYVSVSATCAHGEDGLTVEGSTP